VMPTIHPMLGLDSYPTVNHQPEFAAFCRTPVADQALVDGAVGMAWTAIDAALTPAVSQRLLAGPEGGTVYSGRTNYPWRFQ
ncbi:MAG: hypothetical protein O3C27_18305, partial [Actinomycetota bacterium]|nr:hypothetical protein [Actinomycetota bacterium]